MALNLIDKVKNLKNLNPELPALQFAKKAAKYISLGSAALFAAAFAYFAHLGAAALKGFLIGAYVGGTGGAIGGAILGAQAGAAIGTVVIPIPIVGTLVGGAIGGVVGAVAGGFLGAAFMGIAGGLIALGLETSSVSIGAAGVGAGVGTTVGVYVGAAAGTAIGVTIATGFISFAVAACTATLIGCVLVPVATVSAPIIVATSTAIGAAVGGAIGFVIGGVGGYVIGKYVLDPTWSYIKGTPNAIGSTVSGGLAGLGHMITGLGSSLVNGAISLGGSLLNGLVDVGSSLIGHLTGATGAIAGQIATVAVGTTIASAATLAILNAGILTPGKFATTTTDTGVQAPHDNPFVSVTKTASPSSISNSDIPETINYKISVLAKTNKILVAGCSDTTIVNKKDGTTQRVNSTFDPSTCPSSIDAGQTVTLNYSLDANDPTTYTDSTIVNTFKIDYDLDTGGGGGTTSCNTNFSFAVSQIALPQIYCGASSAFGVPAAIISAFSAVEGSQVFGYPDDQINQYSSPGAKDPYKAGFEPYAEYIIGCTVSPNGAAGPIQFLYGPAQPLVSAPVYPTKTAETDITWGQYRTAVNDAGDTRTPQVCNIKDSIYATAKKNRADCGVGCSTAGDWTQPEVNGAVLSYFPDCTTKWASLGNKSYCEFVWDWYQSHKVP